MALSTLRNLGDHHLYHCLQAALFSTSLSVSGYRDLFGTMRNTSCINAALNLEAYELPFLPSAAHLVLVDAAGLEDIYNNAAQRLHPLGGLPSWS